MSAELNEESFAAFVDALEEMSEPEGEGCTAHTSSVSVRDWEAIRAASSATETAER